MKKEWADKWVAALRSGDYQQGQGSLKQLNRSTDEAVPSFCCLGVLADLAKEHENIKGYWVGQQLICKHTRDCAVLPFEVQKETGMFSQFGDLTDVEDFNSVSLVDFNDTFGKSFEEIAQIIEKHWEQL